MDGWHGWTNLLAGSDGLLLLAAVLVAGALAGEAIARTTRLPRLVGYTLAGSAAALLGAGVPMPLQGAARLLVDLALGLLLFEVGSHVRLRWLRRNPGLLATSLLESAAAGLAVFATLRLLDHSIAVAAAGAVLAVPTSAAVAGRVALELGADGQVTQRMGLLTALNTVFGAVALAVLDVVLLHPATGADAASALARALPLLTAVLVAAGLAAAVAVVARHLDLRDESTVLLVLGLVLFAMAAARLLGASTLLVPVLAGLLLRNLSDRPWVFPRHFGTAGGVLVLLLFVTVGASWNPATLAVGALSALALLSARLLARGGVVLLLAPWSRLSLRQAVALAATLTPLSATALVMLSELMRAAPAVGAEVAPIVLTAVAVFELLGPVLVQLALRHAGELAPARTLPGPRP